MKDFDSAGYAVLAVKVCPMNDHEIPQTRGRYLYIGFDKQNMIDVLSRDYLESCGKLWGILRRTKIDDLRLDDFLLDGDDDILIHYKTALAQKNDQSSEKKRKSVPAWKELHSTYMKAHKVRSSSSCICLYLLSVSRKTWRHGPALWPMAAHGMILH